MTIDKEQLKALALAATQGVWLYDGSTLNDWEAGSYSMECMPNGEDCEDGANANFKADGAYMAAANPATVLALLDEIEQLSKNPVAQAVDAIATAAARHLASEAKGCVEKGLLETIEQLKAENEALRKDAERYRWLRDGAGYCDTRDIPGMAPARMDAFIDAAMAKEAGHE